MDLGQALALVSPDLHTPDPADTAAQERPTNPGQPSPRDHPDECPCVL